MAKKLTSAILLVEGGRQDADLVYTSGFSAPDPVVLLVNGRRKSLVVSLLEFGRAKAEARVSEVLTPQLLGLEGVARNRLSQWAIAVVKRARLRTVRVSANFPVMIADQLREAGIRVEVSSGPLFPNRRQKSPAEIKEITKTQRAAVAAMRAAMEWIRSADRDRRGYLQQDGKRLTSERVRRLIEQRLLESDCAADETIVAGGCQGAEPHERGHGPLRTGQPIVIDIFPRHKQSGYCGDITRTVVHGQPTPEVARMLTAVKAAHGAALKAVRPGVAVKTIHGTAQETLLQYGFETTVKNGWGEGFIHSTGHGIGLEIHEAPSINLSSTRLMLGDVITIEPGLYYRRWGGVRIEDTVVVTREGAKILARCPYP